MNKYLTAGALTSLLQTALGVGVALFPAVFSSSVQAEANTAIAGLIGSIFGVIHLVQHIRTNSR